MAGKTVSGKTTASKAISRHLCCPLVSFGGILKEYSIKESLPHDRESLQNLGQKLICDLGYSGFLDWVIDKSPQINQNDTLVVDGFRHHDIYRYFIEIFPRSILIYCSCDRNLQIQRLKERDKINTDQAINIISHPIEQGIEQLREYADIILEEGFEIKNLLTRIDLLL